MSANLKHVKTGNFRAAHGFTKFSTKSVKLFSRSVAFGAPTLRLNRLVFDSDGWTPIK